MSRTDTLGAFFAIKANHNNRFSLTAALTYGTAANNLRASNLNDLCFQCHAEYQGPFTFQHAPVVESCTKCHTSHGSMQRSLLAVSQPTLCLQCHAGHHNGSGIPLLNGCTSCHSSIHGTDIPSATGGSVFMDK